MTGTSPEICVNIQAFRFDCGCLYYPCEEGDTDGVVVPQINSCLIEDFFVQNTKLDFGCDQLAVDSFVVLSENIGVCSAIFDGSIENFMCLITSDDNCEFPPEGSFKFTDGYGIIHIAQWEFYANRIDITWTTFDPRVPGEDPDGFMVGRQVYRKGIITTTRQVIDRDDDGNITIVDEAVEQKIDFFRTTFDCDDTISADPFRYHLDCAVSDEVEITEVGTSGS